MKERVLTTFLMSVILGNTSIFMFGMVALSGKGAADMNEYTKCGFLVDKSLRYFLVLIHWFGLFFSLLMMAIFCFEHAWIITILFLCFGIYCLIAALFFQKTFFATYEMDCNGILLKDGFKKDLRFITWRDCNYIRVLNVSFITPKSGRIPEDWERYPYFVFLENPVDIYCKNTKGEKTESNTFWSAFKQLKLIMIPMTPQNVEFIQKFFEIDYLLKEGTTRNCYNWNDPRTWGRDQ